MSNYVKMCSGPDSSKCWFVAYKFVSTGPQFEQQMQHLRSELAASPPIPGSFKAKKGVSCVAKFTDGLW